jgi:hypothetical protein
VGRVAAVAADHPHLVEALAAHRRVAREEALFAVGCPFRITFEDAQVLAFQSVPFEGGGG